MLEEPGQKERETSAVQISLAVAVGVPLLHLLLVYAPMLFGKVDDPGSPFMLIPGCGYVIFQGFVLYSVTKGALLANQPNWRKFGIVLGATLLLDCTCVGLPIAVMILGTK